MADTVFYRRFLFYQISSCTTVTTVAAGNARRAHVSLWNVDIPRSDATTSGQRRLSMSCPKLADVSLPRAVTNGTAGASMELWCSCTHVELGPSMARSPSCSCVDVVGLQLQSIIN